MAKNSVADWDTDSDNNTDIGGTNIGEGCSPSGINNAIREMMAQVKALNPVGYASLSPTAEEQGQARANIGADLLGGFRNKVINGDFVVQQRLGTGDYPVDRWRVNTTSGMSCAYATVTATPGAAIRKFGRFTFTGTGAAGSNVRQRIEGANTLAGKTVTLTAWVALATPGSVRLSLRQNFGTGGSPSAETSLVEQSFEVTADLTRYDAVLDVPSVLGKTFGTNGDDYLELLIILDEPNAQTLSVTHVSLVEGDATAEADPFSPRHIQQELALCQRYYEKSYRPDVAPGTIGNTDREYTRIPGDLSNGFVDTVRYKVTKRASATVTIYSPVTGAAGKIRNDTAASDRTAITASDGVTGLLWGQNDTASAALSYVGCHWTADAEL